MEFIVANVDNMKFDIEVALEEQYGALPLPFAGMDKSIAAVCEFYPKGSCQKGAACPFRHVRGDRTIVCKHWLRGLCKKGDQCEFLHEYDMSKMPECYFYSRFNACHNKECPFLHIDPESKIKDCPWYDRGFCRHGPNCRHRHVRRVLCMNYVAGLCIEGPECKFMHPRFELPATDVQQKDGKKLIITCHYCGETGHKAMYCNKMPPEMKEAQSKQEDFRIPDNFGIVEAATMTVNPCTAYRMLRDFVSLSRGETVIQNGANSAAGQYLIQLCRVWGFTSVNIVRNRENIDELKAFLVDLGASYVLTEEELRTTELFRKSVVPKPKLALNCVGGKNALECLRHLDRGGTMVTYGGMSREPVTVPTSALIFKDIRVCGFWMTRWGGDHAGTPEQAEMFQDISKMYAEGNLKAPVHKLIPFSNYKEGLENTMTIKGFTGLKYIIDFQS